MFTRNCREAFRSVSWGKSKFYIYDTEVPNLEKSSVWLQILAYLRKIYERTRWPIVPIYGMFPVKLM